MRDHWKDAIAEGVEFEILSTTDPNADFWDFDDAWMRLFPVQYRSIQDLPKPPGPVAFDDSEDDGADDW